MGEATRPHRLGKRRCTHGGALGGGGERSADADAHGAWQTAGEGTPRGSTAHRPSVYHAEKHHAGRFFAQTFFGCDYLFSVPSQSVCLSMCAHLHVCACVCVETASQRLVERKTDPGTSKEQ